MRCQRFTRSGIAIRKGYCWPLMGASSQMSTGQRAETRSIISNPGKNYGWPTVSYGIDYSGGRISPFEAYPETEQSLVHFTPSIAPSGFAQYSGDKFPDWQGDLFLSALALTHVRHVEMSPDGSLGAQAELFGELGERFRDVRTGPDGYLYLLTESKDDPMSRILRVRPN